MAPAHTGAPSAFGHRESQGLRCCLGLICGVLSFLWGKPLPL